MKVLKNLTKEGICGLSPDYSSKLLISINKELKDENKLCEKLNKSSECRECCKFSIFLMLSVLLSTLLTFGILGFIISLKH